MSSMTPDSTEPLSAADRDGRFASASARDPLEGVLDGLSMGQLQQAMIRARLHHDSGVRDALARAGAAMDPPALSPVLASQLGRLLDSAVLFESSSDRDDDAQELVRAACLHQRVLAHRWIRTCRGRAAWPWRRTGRQAARCSGG